jgi:hypothetical protein
MRARATPAEFRVFLQRFLKEIESSGRKSKINSHVLQKSLFLFYLLMEDRPF